MPLAVRSLALACLLALLASPLVAQPASVMPVPVQQFFDDSGEPLNGGTLTFYSAGTTTPQAIYSDSTLSTPLSNPLTLDADGRTATNVYLSNTSYKILLKNSAGSTIWTADHIASPSYVAQQSVLPVVQTTTSTGSQNDFDLACTTTNTFCVLRANNATSVTFTGFEPMTTGTRLLVLSVGAGDVLLAHQNGSSTAADRLINFVTGTTTPLAAGSGHAEFVYDGTSSRWRMTRHAQGAAITYTPTLTPNTGTLTSASATGRYVMDGRSVLFSITITITTNGTAGTLLAATLPTAAAAARFVCTGQDRTAALAAVCAIDSGASGIALWKYDGTYPGADGKTLVASGVYEVP